MGTDHKLQEVLDGISSAEKNAGRKVNTTQLIAVSKTFSGERIESVLQAGHRVFGENRVQESQGKWPQLKQKYPDVELHLIGPLQSNKTADAVELFDVIHTVDREKIAKTLAAEMSRQGRSLKLFVQVNTGLEEQKAGVDPDKVVEFVDRCRTVHGLEISGLMCIPPFDENPGPHFALLGNLAKASGVEELSMGMSGDYPLAIEFGSTSVRVGSAIFGAR
ncbi:MAG: YggS family pyridoxal phosphate-dependent enzyme [Rhizobiaceae bacterium]